jgi:uncharacterized protein YqeY
MLYEQINADLKTAMKAHEQSRVEVLRFVLSGLNNVAKEKQIKEPGATLTDEETISDLQKEVKRRRDSIELFKQGGRTDLVTKEEGDLAIISVYLPKELTHAEIEQIVDAAIATVTAAGGQGGAKDFSGVMKETMKAVKGRADGKVVTEIIKAKLG